MIEDDFEFGIYDVDSLETQHSATGRWLQRWCPGIGAVDVDGYFLIPEGGLVDPYQLALDALASVAIAPPAIRRTVACTSRCRPGSGSTEPGGSPTRRPRTPVESGPP